MVIESRYASAFLYHSCANAFHATGPHGRGAYKHTHTHTHAHMHTNAHATLTHPQTHTHTCTHWRMCTSILEIGREDHAFQSAPRRHMLAQLLGERARERGRGVRKEGGDEERREAGRRRGNGVSRSLARSLARSLSRARARSLSLALARSEASLPDHVTTIPTNNVVARALFPPPLLYVPLAVSFSLPPSLPLSLSLPDPPSLVGGTYIKGRRSPIDSRLPRS